MSQVRVGFHGDYVTVKTEEYLAVHEENFQLRQENMLYRTALERSGELARYALTQTKVGS